MVLRSFYMLARIALHGFQKIDFQANLSPARSLLTLLSLKSIFITSSQFVFFGLPLPAEPDTENFWKSKIHFSYLTKLPRSQSNEI